MAFAIAPGGTWSGNRVAQASNAQSHLPTLWPHDSGHLGRAADAVAGVKSMVKLFK
jgi:hypothetical protein